MRNRMRPLHVGRRAANAGRPAPRVPSAPMASRCAWPYILSEGVDQSATYRQFHLAFGPIGRARLVYANPTCSGSAPDTVTVSASIEDAAETPHAVTFGGSASVAIPVNGYAISDWLSLTALGVALSAGQRFATRSYASTASPGGKWAANAQIRVDAIAPTSNYRLGYEAGVDRTASGTVAACTSTVSGFNPVAVLAEVAAGTPCVAVMGDSITAAIGDVSYVDYEGYADKAFVSAGFGALRFGFPAATTGGLNASTALKASMLALLAEIGCSDAVGAFGVNDSYNGGVFATIQADMQSLWAYFGAGRRMWQLTVCPQTTGTFTSAGGQTAVTGYLTRNALNDWILTDPTGLRGHFDCAPGIEDGTTREKWKSTGGTARSDDGVHPNYVIGHQEYGAGITPASFGP